jgi:hypothetical protein
MAGVALVLVNEAVVEVDDPLAAVGDGGIVGDEDDGAAGVDQLVKELEDLLAGLGIERAGGLVGQEQLGPGDEGARYGHALSFSSG